MSFKLNQHINNFPIGRFTSLSDGTEISTGNVSGTYMIDGVEGSLSGTISYKTTAKMWAIDPLYANEINGSIGGYSFTPHTPAVGGGIFIGIKTVQNLLSEVIVSGLSDNRVRADIYSVVGNDPAASGLVTILDDIDTTLGDSHGTGNWALTESGIASYVNDTLSSDHGAGSWETAGAGAGAYTVNITVNDGSSALQNALVRLSEGINTYIGATDSDGEITFNLDAATYTVSITKAGYSFSGTSLVISGNTSQTYSMSAISIAASDNPLQTNAYLYTYDTQGNIEGSVDITFKLVGLPREDGWSFDGNEFTGTSNVSGLLQIDLLRGAIYQAKRGTGSWIKFTTPDENTYELPRILGLDG